MVTQESTELRFDSLPQKTRRQKLGILIFGVLLLSALVLVVINLGDLEEFVGLLRQAEPGWLLIAIVLQFGTYTCVAVMWHLALRAMGQPLAMSALIPLGIAKLFTDQALPSGGLSGAAFFVTALKHRNVPTESCLAVLLLNIVAYYGASLLAAFSCVLLLWIYHSLNYWIIGVATLFCMIAVGVPGVALWLRDISNYQLPSFLLRFTNIKQLLDALGNAPDNLLRNPELLIMAILLNFAVIFLDSATLWVMLQMIDISHSYWTIFPSFVMASMVATLSPIPMGLGSFEVTAVGMLGLLGVPVEAALTATLLLRGFTLWLPMLPGLWLVNRALR